MRNLHIDRRLLLPTAQEFLENLETPTTITDFKTINPAQGYHRLMFHHDGTPLSLEVFYNGNGTTTLKIEAKYRGSIVEDLALKLIEKSKFLIIEGTHTVDNFSVEDVNVLVDFIKESNIATVINNNTTDAYQECRYVFQSPHGDKVSIILYNSGKLLLQGTPLLLMNEVLSLLAELGIENLGKPSDVIPLPETELLMKLEHHMPDSYNKIQPTLKKMLVVPFALEHYPIALNDYSYIPFSSLRALEGHIKRTLSGFNVFPDVHGCLHCFHEINGHYVFKARPSTQSTEDTYHLNLIEKSYDYYNKTRHELFHMNEFFNNRILRSRTEAMGIVYEVIQLIEDYYRVAHC